MNINIYEYKYMSKALQRHLLCNVPSRETRRLVACAHAHSQATSYPNHYEHSQRHTHIIKSSLVLALSELVNAAEWVAARASAMFLMSLMSVQRLLWSNAFLEFVILWLFIPENVKYFEMQTFVVTVQFISNNFLIRWEWIWIIYIICSNYKALARKTHTQIHENTKMCVNASPAGSCNIIPEQSHAYVCIVAYIYQYE